MSEMPFVYSSDEEITKGDHVLLHGGTRRNRVRGRCCQQSRGLVREGTRRRRHDFRTQGFRTALRFGYRQLRGPGVRVEGSGLSMVEAPGGSRCQEEGDLSSDGWK